MSIVLRGMLSATRIMTWIEKTVRNENDATKMVTRTAMKKETQEESVDDSEAD